MPSASRKTSTSRFPSSSDASPPSQYSRRDDAKGGIICLRLAPTATRAPARLAKHSISSSRRAE